IGTNTWSAGQSGYTLNLIGTDSLGAVRVSPNASSTAYHPSATISSGHSVPPGGQATFSMIFVAPETSGSVTDVFQLNSAAGTYSAAHRGGGLNIPSRVPPTYGEPGAGRLVNTVLIGGGYATEVSSLSQLSPGDLIGWNWEGDSNIQNLDHVVLYAGNGLVAA